MGFTENLKGELEYKGMMVKELSHKTGISKHTLDKYLLTNSSMPPADKAVVIAQALGVSVEYLVYGKKIIDCTTRPTHVSPEMRSITGHVEPLSREKRRIVESAVTELVWLLNRPMKDEPAALTPLQKAFLRLFR